MSDTGGRRRAVFRAPAPVDDDAVEVDTCPALSMAHGYRDSPGNMHCSLSCSYKYYNLQRKVITTNTLEKRAQNKQEIKY